MEPAALHSPTNSAVSPTPSKVRFWFFTLGIILFAGYLVIFVPTLSQDTAERRLGKDAARTAQFLHSALDLYLREQRTFPRLPGSPATGDVTLTTGPENALIAILTDFSAHPLTATYNRRGIPFFSERRAPAIDEAGLWQTANTIQLNDPWGRPFQVILDTDSDGMIDVPDGHGSTVPTAADAVVICLGPDGDWGISKPGEVEDIIVVK